MDGTGVFPLHMVTTAAAAGTQQQNKEWTTPPQEAELPARIEETQPLLDFARPKNKKRWTFIEAL